MPHCTKCGTALADNASFCTACGAPQAVAAPAPPAGVPAPAVPVAAPGESGLQENVAALLSYVVGWITGLIFFLVDKRPNVQFHARQSITLFGGLSVLYFVLVPVMGIGTFVGFGLVGLLIGVIDLAAFVLWIICMIKAYQGERFRIPVVADLSEKIFGKV